MSDEAAIELAMQAADGPVSGRIVLPLRVRIGSVEAVLVSAEAFDAVFRAARKGVGHRTRVERDPEVQHFIDERLETHDLPSIRDGVSRRFGPDRTPSPSGLHRYAMSRREAAKALTRPARGRRGPRDPR